MKEFIYKFCSTKVRLKAQVLKHYKKLTKVDKSWQSANLRYNQFASRFDGGHLSFSVNQIHSNLHWGDSSSRIRSSGHSFQTVDRLY